MERPSPGGAGEATGQLVVATIRRPHGVRGELSLTLETDRPGAVFRSGRALQLGDARGRPLGRWLTITRVRPIKDGMLLQAAEIEGLTPEVEALRGHTLLIPREEAAPPSEDEFPYHDLVGSQVVVRGERVGIVREVLETNGAELLVVRRPGGRELLVPFVKEMIRGVDVARREVDLDPPEGLLEL